MEQAPSNMQLTKESLRDSLLDMIIFDDDQYKKLSKQNNVGFVVQKDIEKLHVKYQEDIDRYFVCVPDSYHEKDMEMVIKSGLAAAKSIRKSESISIKNYVIKKALIDEFELDVENSLIDFEDYAVYKQKLTATSPKKGPPKREEPEHPVKPTESSSVCVISGSGLGLEDDEDDSNEIIEAPERSTTREEIEHTVGVTYEPIDEKSIEEKFFNSDVVYTKDQEISIKRISAQLLKSFKGCDGKEASILPSKRMVKREIQGSDKIYVHKTMYGGKFIKNITFIVDCSGSMGGKPIDNASIIVSAFSDLARRGYCTGTVICTKKCDSITLDLADTMLHKYMTANSMSEGIEKAMRKNINVLQESSMVFCLTDGDITDAPIDKQVYVKHRIETIGLYVNRDATKPELFNEKLKQWFDRSICRQNVDDAINTIIALGLRNKR